MTTIFSSFVCKKCGYETKAFADIFHSKREVYVLVRQNKNGEFRFVDVPKAMFESLISDKNSDGVNQVVLSYDLHSDEIPINTPAGDAELNLLCPKCKNKSINKVVVGMG